MALLADGLCINETYEVEAFLGEGAFAEVYRVKHRFLGRQAMKFFKAPGWSPDEVSAMLGEAVLLSKINHPNIVRVYDANTASLMGDTFGFFTMEYIAGGSLSQYWRSFGAQFMPVKDVVEVMRQVCKGIAVAHSHNPPIIHRDIKPQNILIGHETNGIRARVSDFGLAKNVNPLTLMATSRGTVSFKAPEALQDIQGDSLSGDVWALGTTLYLLLTDRLPYEIEDGLSHGTADTFSNPPPPPSRWNALCDSELDQVVLKGLKVDPKERYGSAMEFLTALEAWRPDTKRTDRAKSGSGSPGNTSKGVLGTTPQAREHLGRQLALRSIAIAQDPARLSEAVRLMEKALNESPELNREYEARLRLWRRGISM
ncbi:serine/threonine protein kinase [Granulicella sp. WH15]|uniref:serine/threonine-protein kinase n=1 Tax=Granulicella sp. WH15 TaxID=2602070 RepID=UPI001366AB74|nr:serine/threonine-protein kinase [Granulicella sp. WH15]QHN03990.1 serine/threonine protein kinase [Granulicella sp. WH15]